MKQINPRPKPIYEEEKTIGFSGSLSYLVELIIQISKYFTKGRGLSKNGVNALLLFLLTAGLLFTHTQFPSTWMDRLKLYSVPLVFLSFFIVDLAKNIDIINRFFRKLGQRTDFIYQNIMEGNINYEDLEYNLSDLNFSYKQITEIMKKLVDSELFTRNAQNSLLLNSAIYRMDTLPLIKDSFINPITIDTILTEDYSNNPDAIGTNSININWTPSAVCIFLSKMRNNLPKKYLDKLMDRYGKYPSVLIAIGHFYKYEKGEDTFLKIGNEFKYTKNRRYIFKVLYLSTFLIFIIVSFFFVNLSLSERSGYDFYFFGTAGLFIITLLLHNYIEKNDLFWSLRSHLKNYDVIKDDFVVNQIISDFDNYY